MERDVQTDLLDLVNALSGHMNAAEIPLKNNLARVKAAFKNHIKNFSIRGLKNLSDLVHSNSHKEALYKLECGNYHCLNCYLEYVNDDAWDPNNAYCIHNRQITPAYRNRIIKEAARLRELLKTCVVCNETKDKMNFAILQAHDCIICTPCIKNQFDPFIKDNLCVQCKAPFRDEAEIIIRSIMEEDMNAEQLLKLYSGKCSWCGNEKDSRSFQMICAAQCKACALCIDQIVKENNCKCGQQISINR